jgi:hypothetical protein
MRWCVLAHLPAREILVCRSVSREWRDTVDRATQEDWKRWYHLQVCDDLCVGDDFDWRRAAVCASSTRRALVAVCLWKARRPLRVEVPWRDDGGASLRHGVVRKIVGVTHIEFVYDNAFWLRALHRSCLRRHAVPACRNCQSKRKCLNPRYDYYLGRLTGNTLELDERLGFRLAQRPMTPHGTTVDDGTNGELEVTR